MRRILFVEHLADIIGGGQISLLGLMGELCREQYEPLFVGTDGGSMERAVREAGIPMVVADFPSLRGAALWRAGIAVWRLWRKMRRERVDLVHVNSSRGMFYAGLAGRLARVPVIWHVRVTESDGNWDRLLAALARRIVVISEAVRGRFAGTPAGEKTRLIHNGVDVAVFARADGSAWRRRLGYGERPLVGMVAQLIEWKRQEYFIRAAARIGARFPEVRFLLVGEEPDPALGYERELRSLVERLGLEEQVAFCGFCDDIPGIMAMLDVLVLTSDNEPFGRVLIEAMAASRPVVATRGGGVTEIVVEEETGLLVPVGDAKATAVAVERLLAQPERALAMGRAGKKRVEEGFSMQAHARRVEALYEEVLAAE